MKNYVLKMVTAVIAMMPLAAPAVNSIIHTATYDFSNMTVGLDSLGGTPYKTLHYQGLYNGGEPGAPSLPIDYIRFSVPHNATNFTVTAVLRDNTFANLGNYMVYPCQQPRLMSDTSAWTITLPDSNIYNSNAYYPASNAWVASEGFLAGENHIVTVAVAPVSYRHNVVGNTASNQLRQSRTVRLTLSYELSDTLAMYPIVRQNDALRQEGYALTRSMVANPKNVEAFAPVDIAMDSLIFINPNGGDGINSNIAPPDSSNVNPDPGSNYGGDLQLMQYPYLIVTTPELWHSVRRIAALNRQKGYNVKVMTVNQIVNSDFAQPGDLEIGYSGDSVLNTTDGGKMRQFLKYSFQRLGTMYVLLAGTDVPILKNVYKPLIPTDYYYSELNSNPNDARFDYLPELYVGRILSKSQSQIDNYSDKLFRYVLNPGHGDYSYLERALYTESHDFKGIMDDLASNMYSLGLNDSLIIRELEYGSYPKGCDIIDTINTHQYGFFGMIAHGAPASVITYGYSKADSLYYDSYYWLWAIDSIKIADGYHPGTDRETGNGLNCIENKYYPMIYYNGGCSTEKYDYVGIPMNFGESFTTGKNYGGPAYVGCTSDVFDTGIQTLSIGFSKNLLEGRTKIGEAHSLSRSYSAFNHNDMAAHAQNLLGDPAIDLWTHIPQLYEGISVTRTDNNISVTGIQNADSTIVAYCNNNGNCITKTTSSSCTFNNVSPNGTIMLYKHNYIPYIATLALQNTIIQNSQYVIASDVIAGRSVDANRTNGDVVIQSGVQYEIEATGVVNLEKGFRVEKGATFAVYPSCF